MVGATPTALLATLIVEAGLPSEVLQVELEAMGKAARAAGVAIVGGDTAALIGEIREQPARAVLSVNSYGGTRIIDMLVGDPLPRIC